MNKTVKFIVYSIWCILVFFSIFFFLLMLWGYVFFYSECTEGFTACVCYVGGSMLSAPMMIWLYERIGWIVERYQ